MAGLQNIQGPESRHRLGVVLFLAAAAASFLLSVGRWFAGESRRGRLRRPVGPVDPRRRRLLDRRGAQQMTGVFLELALAIVGVAITFMVVVGMILIVPSGVEAAQRPGADPVPAEPDRGWEPASARLNAR